jgi:hypothetical protein
VIVAADSSKLGQRAFARICAAESVDTLVTDVAVSGDMVRRFEEAGVGSSPSDAPGWDRHHVGTGYPWNRYRRSGRPAAPYRKVTSALPMVWKCSR